LLGQRLKKLREVQKLTQKNLAKMLGVGTSTVAMWETGDRHPDHEMLLKIADLFDVSVDSLLGRYVFEEKVDYYSDRIKYMSELEKMREKVVKSFDQALDEGNISQDQAKIGLTIIQQAMDIIIEANKSK